MVTEIRVYVEGGGDQKSTLMKLREAMGMFLVELRDIAVRKKIKWGIIASGSRQEAYDDFCIALRQRPSAFNVLLVDSEVSIVVDPGGLEFHRLPWAHLKERDGWNCPPGATHARCFLMVETMEAWLLADPVNLKRFYLSCIDPGPLDKADHKIRHQLETMPKADVFRILNRATARCKQPYHKTRHAFDLLATCNPRLVRQRAPHCKRLFDVLARQMGERIP